MRRKDREIVDVYKIEEIIAKARYMHLGILDGEYPYVVPLHYGYLMENGKLTFFVHSAKEGHKLDCIQKSSNVFVEIEIGENLIASDRPCGYSAEYKSVMCRGKASIIKDKKKKCVALKILMEVQTGEKFEINEKMAETVTIIQIDIDSYSAKACVRYDSDV